MANQIPIKVICDGSGNTCGLAQFTSSDSIAVAAGGTGLTTQGICEFVQPGLYAVGCQVTYLGICAGKADTGAGKDNTYAGHSAGTAVTTGCQHTIIGSQAGKAITTCHGTVAVGYNAGLAQTFGDFNTLIGTAGGAAITTASSNTVVGYHAGTATICSNNIAIGTCAMVANTQGQENVAIGVKAGATQVAAGCNNVFVGSNAGAVSLCRDNVSIGSYAGKAATTGGGNVMIGACVGYGVVGGASNVYIGDKSGLANTSGNANVFIGNCAGCAATGSCCLIIGNGTCDLITGSFATPSLTLDADTFVSNGKGVVIGHTSQLTVASVAAEFQYLGTGGADRTMVLGSWVASTGNANVSFIKSRNATIGSNTIVNDDDPLGSIFFYGDDGTDFNSQAASIIGYVDGTPGTGDMPGRLVFSTTADGAESATERMRIDAAGKVGIGTTAPDGTLHVFTSTAGSVAAHANADDLVIENGGPVGISLFADDNPVTIAMGGNAATNLGGYIQYDYNGGDEFMIFATNVTEAMRIDCDQNVGIGTTAPYSACADTVLHIKGAATSAMILQDDEKAYTHYVNGYYLIKQGTTTRFFLEEDTINVGIGTTAAAQNLVVADTNAAGPITIRLKRTNSTAASGVIDWVGSGDAVGYSIGYNEVTGLGFEFNENGDCTRMYIKDGGDLGLGTTAPCGKMQINAGAQMGLGIGNTDQSTIGVTPHLWLGSASATGNVAQIAFGYNNSNTYTACPPAVMGYITSTATGYSHGHLFFATRAGTTNIAPTERMRITTAGDVGIGTASPGSKLHVVQANNDYAIRVTSATDNDYKAQTSIEGEIGIFKLYPDGSTGSNAGFQANGSGVVGIGATPLGTHADWNSITLGGTAYMNSPTTAAAGKSLYISQNAHLDTDGSEEYIVTDEASSYSQLNGTHNFRVAPSGTAGNNITMTTAMTIDNDANVVVGGTATCGGLHVVEGTKNCSVVTFTGCSASGTSTASAKLYAGVISDIGDDSAVDITDSLATGNGAGTWEVHVSNSMGAGGSASYYGMGSFRTTDNRGGAVITTHGMTMQAYTTDLTGTTGGDGQLNIGLVSGGTIVIENRLGFTISLMYRVWTL